MGLATIPFVNSVNAHAQQSPQFVPSFIDAAELNKDVVAVNEFNSYQGVGKTPFHSNYHCPYPILLQFYPLKALNADLISTECTPKRL